MTQDGGEPCQGPAEDIEDADPVQAGERTELAWTRSAISFFALGLAILKLRPVVGIPLLAFSGVTWLIGRASPTRDRAATNPRRILLVTVAVCALAVVALVLEFVARGSPGLRP